MTYDMNKKWLHRLVSIFIVLVILMSAKTIAFADDDEHEKEFSFYRVSSAATSFFDEAYNGADEKNKDGLEKAQAATFGNAGAYVGFMDEDYHKGFFGAIVSRVSSSSQDRNYTSVYDTNEAVTQYMQYGHVLQALGLDEVGSMTLDFSAIGRLFAGIILWLMYTVASLATLVMAVSVGFLKMLNPFGWFRDIAADSVVGDFFSKNAVGTNVAGGSWIFSGVARFIQSYYTFLQDIGLVVVSLIFLIGVALALIFWKKSEGISSKFRKFFIRLLFLFIGIPLLGSLYTMTLDGCQKVIGSSNYAADQVLMSTLVDFQGWAENSNLALPSGTRITVKGANKGAANVDASATTGTRQLARKINSITYASVNSGDDSSILSKVDESQQKGAIANFISNYSDGSALIGRYMKSSYYTASDYETYYKKFINRGKTDATSRSEFYASFAVTGDADTYKGKTLEEISGESSTNDEVLKKIIGSIFKSGLARADGAVYMNNGDAGISAKGRSTITYSGSWDGVAINSYQDHGGLSTMAMYNYLTTDFGDSTVRTYSANKVMSHISRDGHRSVALIGTGGMKLLYLLSALSIFAGTAVITICYGLRLMFAGIGRGFHMIMSVPFAMLGNLKAMAKVATYGLMMICEVVGTMIAYAIAINLFIDLQTVWETPLETMLSSQVSHSWLVGTTNAFSAAPFAITTTALIFTIFFNIFFTISALRWRKAVVKAMDGYMGDMMDRLFTPGLERGQGAGASVVNTPTAGEKVKGGLKAAGDGLKSGIGMAAGAKMMSAGTEGLNDGIKGLMGAVNKERDPERMFGGSGVDTDSMKDGKDSASRANFETNAGRFLDSQGASSLKDLKALPGPSDDKNSAKSLSADDAKDSKKQEKDLATERRMKSLTGDVSALEQEAQHKETKEVKKQARKDKIKGSAKAAGGAVIAGVGAKTGNAKMMAKGSRMAAQGANDVRKAGSKSRNASTKVAAKREAMSKDAPQKVEKQSQTQQAPKKADNRAFQSQTQKYQRGVRDFARAKSQFAKEGKAVVGRKEYHSMSELMSDERLFKMKKPTDKK